MTVLVHDFAQHTHVPFWALENLPILPPAVDKTGEYEARTKAHWDAEKSRLEADVRAHTPDVSAFWREMRAEAYGSPAFKNYTAFLESGQAAPIT
jgi:hypothetical protein